MCCFISSSQNFLFIVISIDLRTYGRNQILDRSLQIFLNRCLSGILNIKWPEMISDQKLWNRMRQEEIIVEMESEKV
jgi:hypothetical protein